VFCDALIDKNNGPPYANDPMVAAPEQRVLRLREMAPQLGGS